MIDSVVNTQSLQQSKGTSVIEELKRKNQEKTLFEKELKNSVDKAKESKKKPVDKKLMDTCVEFESIFVSRMLTEMRKTVHKGEMLHGGRAEEIFEDFLYDEYAKMTSKNSNLGIATMLYKQLS